MLNVKFSLVRAYIKRNRLCMVRSASVRGPFNIITELVNNVDTCRSLSFSLTPLPFLLPTPAPPPFSPPLHTPPPPLFSPPLPTPPPFPSPYPSSSSSLFSPSPYPSSLSFSLPVPFLPTLPLSLLFPSSLLSPSPYPSPLPLSLPPPLSPSPSPSSPSPYPTPPISPSLYSPFLPSLILSLPSPSFPLSPSLQLHSKSYASDSEEKYRRAVWRSNLKFIEDHDAKAEGFQVAMNKFGDLVRPV